MIFAKEMRSGAVLAPLFVLEVEALREAAKRGSFRGLGLTTRVPVPHGHRDRKAQIRAVHSSVAKQWACPW
ncbi:hypothetical protein GCM10010334_06700 [Streptomyces finlayi]|uniref:Uncharacterized protein n=1 Tax=Streptomyces finlayi TaxID=67296 RepID=A0A918WT22_9ACTN|nr:hypothetical protein GCM10010334_06700 [Streptomyces finlayi]